MQAKWWYAEGDERRGPVQDEQLRAAFSTGAIGLQTLVWRQGMPEWLPFSQVDELRNPIRAPLGSAAIPGLIILRWRRFLARSLDVFVLSILLAYPIGYFGAYESPAFAAWIQKPGSDLLFGFMLIPVALFAEAVVFGVTGSTLGKSIFGVQLRTLAGGRLSFATYLNRQVGVYWSGIGLGIPLVNLVTCLAQYNRLGSGKSASYDKERFAAVGPKMSLLRGVLATFAVVTALLLNAIITQATNTRTPPAAGTSTVAVVAAAAPQPFAQPMAANSGPPAVPNSMAWTNAATGETAVLPPGWSYQPSKDSVGQDMHIFSDASGGVAVVFAHEDYDQPVSLPRYATVWTETVKGSMKLVVTGGESRNGRGEPIMKATGTLADGITQVRVTLFRRGNRVWRIVVISEAPAYLDRQDVSDLKERVVATL